MTMTITSAYLIACLLLLYAVDHHAYVHQHRHQQRSVSWCASRHRLRLRTVVVVGAAQQAVDHYDTFSPLERQLFKRFSESVCSEMGYPVEFAAKNYSALIDMVNTMTFSRPSSNVNAQGKNMLVRLFPAFLLPTYKIVFRPFLSFSIFMNAYVTLWTTKWLMGPSKLVNLDAEQEPEQERKQQQNGPENTMTLQIEKCRFLEASGCVRTCLHACKIPTQDFFFQEMGLPVSVSPNLTDMSCKFVFGKSPVDWKTDPSLVVPCFSQCSQRKAIITSGDAVFFEKCS